VIVGVCLQFLLLPTCGLCFAEWDNLFASLMAGLFDKDIAYSNLFVSVRSRTPDGFLPNWSTAGGIRRSGDRTEPPIGARILLELYRKYKDTWIVEALWEDLVEWNDWFMRERLLEPLGLIGLRSYGGSDHAADDDDDNNLQAARYESGLDNSPM
jgi:putative isomerase